MGSPTPCETTPLIALDARADHGIVHPSPTLLSCAPVLQVGLGAWERETACTSLTERAEASVAAWQTANWTKETRCKRRRRCGEQGGKMGDSGSKTQGLLLGQEFPNFEADSSQGKIVWHDYINEKWAILFSHPADFTPVCTTELGTAAQLAPEFAKRNVVMAALSVDSAESHKAWIKDIIAHKELGGDDIPYPILADEKRDLAVKFGMLDPDEKDGTGMPVTARAVFIIGPDKKLKLSILYPATTGRNFDEILRVVDSLQLTAYQSVATPANWNVKGGASTVGGGSTDNTDCMVVPSISDDEAKEKFKKGFTKAELPSGKGYIRYTPDPRSAM
ncbi:Peroxiredoxin-6 (1-Cys peroxiredoxin) (1-Cys PRX) (Acidic calcium-independent phospholipase A2) (aiPLA2) (Glutathione-dependent peroxiredoxin) (Lysophosphatidylcholine acyltransferase 5) (LPC acyltransferase 5) (LPCAT-5) (Lyso-PC acyltransferase 5) (Non-selenium glutathione peroxidase) (NSGPx) [Durusdinium trenchii]|uniref:Thioredoxin domain-containing protein n=1 Tax=Durusdinium trenchii TaxID=1381693 RepID=A0ABP0KY66_9DINO